MWVYIILLTAVIGGLWLAFFKKEIAAVLKQNDKNQGISTSSVESSLAEIFGIFGQSISEGAKVFSEIKQQLPKTSTTSINASTTTNNLVK